MAHPFGFFFERVGIPDTRAVPIRGCLQSGEVFLQEHFVLALLYVQLRACSVGVYGRAFLDFRKMFGTTEKGVALRSTGKIRRRLKQSLQHPGGRNPRPFENREDRGSLSSHDVGKEGMGQPPVMPRGVGSGLFESHFSLGT